MIAEDKVPRHLEHRISQEAWVYINQKAEVVNVNSLIGMRSWMIRSWFITYLCNENKKDLIYCLRNYTSITIFELIELLHDLKSFLKVDKSND